MILERQSNPQQIGANISSNYENNSMNSWFDISDDNTSLQNISERIRGVRISKFRYFEILEILDNIFNYSSDILLIVDSEGLINEIVSAHEDYLSYKSEYFVGKCLDQFTTVEYFNHFKSSVKKIYVEGEPFIKAKFKNQVKGEIKLLEVILFPALEDKIALVCKNILRNTLLDKKFPFIWDNSFEGMILSDIEGHLLDVNDAFLKISGLTRKDVIGKCLWDVIEIEDQFKNQVMEAYRNSFNSPEITFTRNRRVKFISSKIVDIQELHTFMEIDPGQKIMFTAFNDITSRVQNKDNQNGLNSFALLGKLSSNLSHEIGNSLCKMKMNIDVYKEEFMKNPELGKVYDTLQKEIANLSNLSNEITQFTRHTEDIPIKINIFKFLEKIGEKMSRRLNDKGIKLNNNTRDYSIICDFTKIQTAFLNLINYSIDSIKKDGIIELTSELYSNTVKLSVIIKDNRDDMADPVQIFNPFDTNKISGSRLSMLISKQIITDLGGSINYLSSAKEGNRFEIQLPCELNG
jgi:PAS domain S-box-containing protein